jgi:hypothetical protein
MADEGGKAQPPAEAGGPVGIAAKLGKRLGDTAKWLTDGKKWRKDKKRWVGAGLAVLSVASLPPLLDVAGAWVWLALVVAAVLVVLGLVSEYCKALTLVLGSIVVPWLCLIGFNFIWHKRPGGHIHVGLWAGLVIAGVIFAVAAAGYLVVWQERPLAVVLAAVALGVANVVGIPLLLSAGDEESHVGAPQPVVAQLDVAIVVPGGAPQPVHELAGAHQQVDWDLRWSVGRAGDNAVDWLLLDSNDEQAARAATRGSGTAVPGSPSWREGADRVVLLDVDGIPPVTPDPKALGSVPARKGEIERWLGLAQRVAGDAQLVVLLQTTDERRIARWRGKVEPQGGTVAAVQELGTRSLTDAVQVLAVQAPGASEELSLAARFRPVLLFDQAETLDAPLDIDAFLRSGRVELCHDDQFKGSRCNRVSRPSDLVSGTTHLNIREHRATDPEIASSIYVHPTTRTENGRDLVYLDYWWYLDGNPAKVASGTTCGIGLAMPGKTCFDHPSDWEGMTVVVDRTGADATPVALQFAEHKDVVRYDFAQVQEYWAQRRTTPPAWMTPQLRQNLARIKDIDVRPLAFVAQGTHATYWTLCTKQKCPQVASGVPDKRHNGNKSWPSNDTVRCLATSCVRLIPTRHRGADPALWNAYDGVWGDRSCILRGAYCTAELSPGAPATQDRYQDPAKITGYVDAHWRFQRCGGKRAPCPALPTPATK